MNPLADFLACSQLPALNTASFAELLEVDEIGHRLATRLVAARPFESWADVLRTRGVGPRCLRNLQAAFPRLHSLAIPRRLQPPSRNLTMHTDPSPRQLFESYLDTRIQPLKLAALQHALAETARRRPLTLGDVLDLVCEGGSWGAVDIDDDLTLGDLLGCGSDERRVAELLEQLVPLEVDPDDPVLGQPISQVSKAN
jgi:hypothetical protein